jgi:hypothetical protein
LSAASQALGADGQISQGGQAGVKTDEVPMATDVPGQIDLIQVLPAPEDLPFPHVSQV